jgi:hypothetical protein
MISIPSLLIRSMYKAMALHKIDKKINGVNCYEPKT